MRLSSSDVPHRAESIPGIIHNSRFVNPPPFKCTSTRSPFTFTSVTVAVSPRLTPTPYFFTRDANSSADPGTCAPESSAGKSTSTRTFCPVHPGSA